jgi:hypothetical protein
VCSLEISEIVKNYAQVAAWAAGAGYFGLKFIQGYKVIDLSVSVSLTRQHTIAPDEDFLVASVELKRGDRGSFRIHEATLFIRQEEKTQRVGLPFQRFSFRQDRMLRFDFDNVSKRTPTLNLAPGETASVSTWVKVNRQEPCTVEAFVLGTGFASLTVGQWRASAVSLPLTQ